jgi:osmoprotectant transport system substrate-binding protein
MTSRTLRRVLLALLAVAVSIGLAACGDNKKSSSTSSGASAPTSGAQPGKGKPPIRMGDKNFAEQYVLGQLYKQALEAKGFTVSLKDNIGSSEITDKALKAGQIDMYPDYTGTVVAELAHNPPTSRPKSADEAYAKAKAYEEKSGFTLLEKTPFVDADANAVLKSFASKHGLKTTSDLKKLPSFTFGAPPENKTRFEGVVGMRQVYGLNKLKFVPLAIGLQYQALDSGKIDVGVVFTTDGQLLGDTKYKILDDDKAIYGFQNVAPVVKKDLLTKEGPAFAETVNAVSAKLTNDAVRRMNQAVSVNKQKPAAVAMQFLKANGLA